jgi:hypothetical protein
MVAVLYFLPTMLCTIVFCHLFTCPNGICLRYLQQDCTLALQFLHISLTFYEEGNTHGNCHLQQCKNTYEIFLTFCRPCIVLWFLVYDQRDAQFFTIYLFNSLHVLSTLCSSSGETNCINTTSGICHCVVCRSEVYCTPHGHGVTDTRGCIDTIRLSWWWAQCARNMWRVK